MKGFSNHICAHIELNTHVNLGFTAQTLAQWGLQCCSLGENGARLTLASFEMHWTRNMMQTLVLFTLHPFSSVGSGFVAFLNLRKQGGWGIRTNPLPIGITKRRLWWVCPLLFFLTLSNLAEKRMESSWPRVGVCTGSSRGRGELRFPLWKWVTHSVLITGLNAQAGLAPGATITRTTHCPRSQVSLNPLL